MSNETSRIARSVAQKRAKRCRHFNGVQNEKCEAGVCYKTLEGSGILPCLPWHCDTSKPVATCDNFATYSTAEIADQEREIEKAIEAVGIARKAITDELARRHSVGDKTVVAKQHHDEDFHGTGYRSAYVAGAGTITCPVCTTGTLKYSRAACNGHVHAACTTIGCVRWME